MPDLSSDLRDYFDAVVGSADDQAADQVQVLPPLDFGPRRRRAAVAGALVAASVIAIVGLALRDDGNEFDVAVDPTTNTTATTSSTTGPAPPPDPIPFDPAVIEPSTGLVDGQVVRVTTEPLDMYRLAGVAQCASDVLADGDITAWCDLDTPTDAIGSGVFDVTVQRSISTSAGRVDCGAAPGRCLIGVRVGSANDPTTYIGEISFRSSDAGALSDLPHGWHELGTGDLPAFENVSMAWTGTDVILAAGSRQTHAYRPSTSEWRELPPIPGERWAGGAGRPGLSWAGGELLVVESSFRSARAAVWDPASGSWAEIDGPPVAGPLDAIGQPGMHAQGLWGAEPALIWTGEAVIDLTHGAVWHPETRAWTELAMPDDLLPYEGLISTNPVWDGTEVIARPWTTTPGLAWSADGTSYRELPGVPADLAAAAYVVDSVAAALDGRVYIVSGTDAGLTASLDAQTGEWRREPDLFDMSSAGCPARAVTVVDRVVVRPCADGSSVVLGGRADDDWEHIGDGEGCCDASNAAWVVVDGTLVSWSTSRDEGGLLTPAFGVWVPPGR